MIKLKSFEDFLTKIKESEIDFRENDESFFNNHTKKDQYEDPILYIEWETGGKSGGSCWGTKPKSYSCSNPEPDFVDFDKVLELFIPNTTYLVYKSIYREVVTADSRKDHDYYGNYTNYAYKKVRLIDLYDLLVNRKLISLK